MGRIGRITSLVGLFALAIPAIAHADGTKTWRVCGGSTFATCASVHVAVVGGNVTVQVWNLSGNSAATYGAQTSAGTVFTGIGFYNLPVGVHVNPGSFQMAGGGMEIDQTGGWKPFRNGTLMFRSVRSPGDNPYQNGIGSGCAQIAVNYANTCDSNFGNAANAVTFTFTITGTWNPNDAGLVLRGRDTFTPGDPTECWTENTNFGPANCTTVTPEPTEMTLIATGLLSLSGAGVLRRRRKAPPTP